MRRVTLFLSGLLAATALNAATLVNEDFNSQADIDIETVQTIGGIDYLGYNNNGTASLTAKVASNEIRLGGPINFAAAVDAAIDSTKHSWVSFKISDSFANVSSISFDYKRDDTNTDIPNLGDSYFVVQKKLGTEWISIDTPTTIPAAQAEDAIVNYSFSTTFITHQELRVVFWGPGPGNPTNYIRLFLDNIVIEGDSNTDILLYEDFSEIEDTVPNPTGFQATDTAGVNTPTTTGLTDIAGNSFNWLTVMSNEFTEPAVAGTLNKVAGSLTFSCLEVGGEAKSDPTINAYVALNLGESITTPIISFDVKDGSNNLMFTFEYSNVESPTFNSGTDWTPVVLDGQAGAEISTTDSFVSHTATLTENAQWVRWRVRPTGSGGTDNISDNIVLDNVLVRGIPQSTPVIGLETSVTATEAGTVISWSVENEADVAIYQVKKLVDGEYILLAEVKAGEEYSVIDTAANGEEYIVIVIDNSGYSQNFVIDTDNKVVLDLQAGWNLVSLPFAQELGEAVFTWVSETQTYAQSTAVSAQQGFWIYAPTAETATFEGISSTEAISLVKGWNLAGPSANMEAPLDLTIYSWEKSYTLTNTLTVGSGYWIFTEQESTLTAE